MRKTVPILSSLRLKTRHLFRAKLVRDGSCLVFTGTRNKRGYGFVDVMIKGKRAPILAHRLAWALYHGRDPEDGLIICHRCNNPSCCNPRHLYQGTQQDNVNDSIKAGTFARGERSGMYGVRGTDHPASRYDKAFKAKVIQDVSNGKPMYRTARDHGITAQTVSRWWDEHIGL